MAKELLWLPGMLVLAACGPAAAGTDGGLDAGRDVDATTMDVDTGSSAPVTTIRIVYPDGATLAVRGSGGPLEWTAGAATVALGGGVYELRTTEITTPLEWKPLLDDETWALGPNYHVDRGQTIEVAPHFTASAGRVIALPDLASATLARPHPIWAYLPPVYGENTAARLPVVYMHDGQNVFDAALAFSGVEWGADEAIDAAASEGRCPDGASCQNDGDCGAARCETFREAIVIAVGNTEDRIDEYTPTMDASAGAGGDADLYLRALVDDLKPSIDTSMRTLTAPEHTVLLGSSLGGLVSAHGGITRAESFGLIGAMSPSTWWDGRVLLAEVATIPSRSTRALRVYLDSGDFGPSSDGVADTADLATAYQAVGYVMGADLEYLVAPGHEHSETHWRLRLPGALAFLLGPRERIVP